MAKIYNSQLTKELIDGIKASTAKDIIPNELAEKVLPVMEVNPKILKNGIVKFARANNATSTTIYTTPTNQDFYLTGFQLAIIKDATATSARSQITAVIDGLFTAICEIPSLTLTAQANTISVCLTHPLKIDRNSTLTVTNTTNVANVSASAVIYGFLDE